MRSRGFFSFYVLPYCLIGVLFVLLLLSKGVYPLIEDHRGVTIIWLCLLVGYLYYFRRPA